MNFPEILTDYQKASFGRVIQKIVKAVGVEEIICFGVQSITQSNWNCFAPEYNKDSIRLDLLVLTDRKEKRNRNALSVLVRQQQETNISINCLVHDWASVIRIRGVEGSFFASVVRNGFSVYRTDSILNRIILPYSCVPVNRILSEWNRLSSLAQNFLTSAQNSIKSNCPELTIFLLHQATEHICRALITGVTGYVYGTHNLAKLLSLVYGFCPPLETIFPCNTNEERELFGILLSSYGDSRYKPDYHADQEKILILANRIQTLHYIAIAFFKLKICPDMKVAKLSPAV